MYCRGDYYSASCEKINAVPARKEILKKERRCFLCLSNGHRVSHCTSNKRCRKCGRKYHQSICEPNPPVRDTETAATTGKETTVILAKTKTCVLLQTACTYAYTNLEELMPVHLLMDNGSQRSYISNQLKSKLKLNTRTAHLNHIWERAVQQKRMRLSSSPVTDKSWGRSRINGSNLSGHLFTTANNY